MPLYEYHCQECNSRFEVRRAIRELEAHTECPHCHSEDVARQVSLFMHMTKDDSGSQISGSGCACGGQCGCGSHSHN